MRLARMVGTDTGAWFTASVSGSVDINIPGSHPTTLAYTLPLLPAKAIPAVGVSLKALRWDSFEFVYPGSTVPSAPSRAPREGVETEWNVGYGRGRLPGAAQAMIEGRTTSPLWVVVETSTTVWFSDSLLWAEDALGWYGQGLTKYDATSYADAQAYITAHY
ncbi:MAG: hypothetical protein NT062_05150 [Proteobacteria bacterium]|nr:hypothetical protein [Pseudomonadota bacterium]